MRATLRPRKPSGQIKVASCIGYLMFCVGYGTIRGIRAPECIFRNQHKTLYNLFSTDPDVSCVCDKLVSHPEIYTLSSILLYFI